MGVYRGWTDGESRSDRLCSTLLSHWILWSWKIFAPKTTASLWTIKFMYVSYIIMYFLLIAHNWMNCIGVAVRVNNYVPKIAWTISFLRWFTEMGKAITTRNLCRIQCSAEFANLDMVLEGCTIPESL